MQPYELVDVFIVANGWKRCDFAEELGIAPPRLTDLLSGRRPIRNHIEPLSRIMGVPSHVLNSDAPELVRRWADIVRQDAFMARTESRLRALCDDIHTDRALMKMSAITGQLAPVVADAS